MILSVLITIVCLLSAAVIQIWSGRFGRAGVAVFTVGAITPVLVVYAHAARQFSVQSDWWFPPLLALVLLPGYYLCFTSVKKWTMVAQPQQNATVQSDIEAVLDELLKEVQ